MYDAGTGSASTAENPLQSNCVDPDDERGEVISTAVTAIVALNPASDHPTTTSLPPTPPAVPDSTSNILLAEGDDDGNSPINGGVVASEAGNKKPSQPADSKGKTKRRRRSTVIKTPFQDKVCRGMCGHPSNCLYKPTE